MPLPQGWTQEQMWNARTIIAVGREMRMSMRDITIALMAAMVESGLRNLNYGDRDSLGMFQQRPSQGWGSAAQVQDPLYASRKFFEGLKRVRNRNNMGLGQAAQAVQRSAYPGRYGERENDAKGLLMQLGEKGGGLPFPLARPQMDLDDYGILDPGEEIDGPNGPEAPQTTAAGVQTPTEDSSTGGPMGIGASIDPIFKPKAVSQALMPGVDLGDDNLSFPALTQMTNGGARERIIAAAMAVRGTPYSWGGGTPQGASEGFAQGAGIVGFDCSGLVQYALAQAGIDTPDMVAAQQMKLGRQVDDISQLQPGDLVASRSGGHIGIYLGDGMMINAPHTGAVVRVQPVNPGMVGIKLSLAPVQRDDLGKAAQMAEAAGLSGEAGVGMNSDGSVPLVEPEQPVEVDAPGIETGVNPDLVQVPNFPGIKSGSY